MPTIVIIVWCIVVVIGTPVALGIFAATGNNANIVTYGTVVTSNVFVTEKDVWGHANCDVP
jgi:hypothetical protein